MDTVKQTLIVIPALFVCLFAGYTLREAEVKQELEELHRLRNQTAETKIAEGIKDLFKAGADGSDASDILTQVYSDVREGKR